MDKEYIGGHTSSQFNRDMESVNQQTAQMGELVRRQLTSSLSALLNLDPERARKVRADEHEVNQLELSIDEVCARVLALHQPEAGDLRLIVAISKVVMDLERIGDESAKIAAMAERLASKSEPAAGFKHVHEIGTRVTDMLARVLTAFAEFDAEAARRIGAADREVDEHYRKAMKALIKQMKQDPTLIKRTLNLLWSLRALERIGDHVRNISEQLIYVVEGKDIRHTPPAASEIE